jgi:hypothetical protein
VRLEAERTGLEAARREERSMLEELQAVRASILEEKERMARDAREELAAEKERMAQMQRAEAEQRMAWVRVQRRRQGSTPPHRPRALDTATPRTSLAWLCLAVSSWSESGFRLTTGCGRGWALQAVEQRKFMEELMSQQRALREQAEWISQEHQSHWGGGGDHHGDHGGHGGHPGLGHGAAGGVSQPSRDGGSPGRSPPPQHSDTSGPSEQSHGHGHAEAAPPSGGSIEAAPGQTPVPGAHGVRADQSPFSPT